MGVVIHIPCNSVLKQLLLILSIFYPCIHVHMVPTMKDLVDAFYYTVVGRWEHTGIRLDLPMPTLKEIDAEHQHDTHKSLIRMQFTVYYLFSMYSACMGPGFSSSCFLLFTIQELLAGTVGTKAPVPLHSFSVQQASIPHPPPTN